METTPNFGQGAAKSRWTGPLLAAVLTLIIVGFLAAGDFPSFGEDSGEYRDLMLNHWDQVHQPFSSRFLHAEVVALLMRGLGMGVQPAAIAVACMELVFTVLGLSWIFARLKINPFLLLPTLIGIAFVQTFRLIYMPDLFYTLLLTGFFLLLMHEQLLWAGAMVFVLFCARESTLVLGVVVTGLSFQAFWAVHRRGRKGAKWPMFAAATVLGFFFNRYVTSKSASNVHEINGLVYMVGKVPFNFLKNVLGIAPWTNTLVATEGDHPLYQHALPHWIRLGAIKQVGICDISPSYPLRWLIHSLCIFGVLLTVVCRTICVRVKNARSIIAGVTNFVLDQPFFSRVAMVYGLISLAIAPILGTAVHRYIYYAWPAFWITGAMLLQQQYLDRRNSIAVQPLRLLIVHLLMAGISFWVSWRDPRWLVLLGLLGVAIVLQWAAWKLLSKISPQTVPTA